MRHTETAQLLYPQNHHHHHHSLCSRNLTCEFQITLINTNIKKLTASLVFLNMLCMFLVLIFKLSLSELLFPKCIYKWLASSHHLDLWSNSLEVNLLLPSSYKRSFLYPGMLYSLPWFLLHNTYHHLKYVFGSLCISYIPSCDSVRERALYIFAYCCVLSIVLSTSALLYLKDYLLN